ncbi:hypothetical protein [Streptomyces nanshensis]|uniref:Uncharacterized protein n=1 Tax=Streptomyces nanshensis TaxID=518642 RepID=A0A1E7L5A1_9ACTN|nr:hypothetical protein [Streptomyces nanshensis]OEV11338.1 hypothetical protein AN218_13380 [Streptomyces nanshensis]
MRSLSGRAAAARPAGTYTRILALDLVAQAKMQLKQGNLEHACGTWSRALDHMDGVHSARTSKALSGIRRDLTAYRSRGVRCAQELDDRAATLLHP